MNKSMKKVLALVICLLMCLSLFPAGALAEEGIEESVPEETAQAVETAAVEADGADLIAEEDRAEEADPDEIDVLIEEDPQIGEQPEEDVLVEDDADDVLPETVNEPEEDELRTESGASDQVEGFVRRAYSLILGREADQSGLDYWVKGLNDKTIKGGDIVSQFMNSDEYVLANHPNTDAVTAVYKTMLDRDPDASGLAYWVGLLDQLCSYNKIISGFCDSPEFKGICEQYGIEPGTVATEPRDVNPNVTAFVARFYECALGRKFDNKGLNYWADQLLSHAATPYEAAHGFVFSEECVNRGLNNTEFVTMLYNLYMDREPEAGGLTYWVGQLDNNSVTREAVEVGFAQSPEFQNIVKSYGL